ncbi:MAG: hypothetical protein NTW68_11820 [candidate division NC10 bacterium]|nr:hypothetical protein [candidate division NC10 bacterium]
MPAPSTAKWPRPKSEDEWEDMVLDAMRLRWRDPNAERNGRRGQRQNGVDVFGRIGASWVAAQAKNTDTLSEADAKAEISKAEGFQPPLLDFYLVICGPRDATFQEFIRLLSAEQVSRGSFRVHVLFFDDVCQELAGSAALVQKYWAGFLALSALLDALPRALTGPVLDTETAFARVEELEEFKALGDHVEAISDGNVHAQIRIEGTPQLDAARGTLDRAWHLAIGESHAGHVTTLCRVAVDVDSGSLSFYSLSRDRWLSRNEWLQTDDLWWLQ